MAILVFVESADGKIKKTSIEAVCYARAMGGPVTAVALGSIDQSELEGLGVYGAEKILHIADERLNQEVIQAYASVLAQAMADEGADILVLSNSSLGTPVAARIAARLNASLASNVVGLPDTSSGFVVKKSIYTGKAFCYVDLTHPKKIIAIAKNVVDITNVGSPGKVTAAKAVYADADFAVRILSSEKASGDVLLPEADIVVSGGRGMKGPENWPMLENLAKVLHAATACSKPVSDMGWRPHHEHVGQTGIKVAPKLYIAVGISGAIQHLAGVNSSKCIVVINKDPEAPFFKAADYGMVGDAFEIIPKLTDAIKAAK
ncbi:MAG TPA: electron transfer flavoprotein subunit alpha/FixB family protein [Chryseosolibacter sp.]|jgi:electron transfer flavoprotein alpha subunit|nr:electron transfer flavoprotein subunit alpha/FixB family protein [Chryseosolibacter sp.]